jgi:hypothetical protein
MFIAIQKIISKTLYCSNANTRKRFLPMQMNIFADGAKNYQYEMFKMQKRNPRRNGTILRQMPQGSLSGLQRW